VALEGSVREGRALKVFKKIGYLWRPGSKLRTCSLGSLLHSARLYGLRLSALQSQKSPTQILAQPHSPHVAPFHNNPMQMSARPEWPRLSSVSNAQPPIFRPFDGCLAVSDVPYSTPTMQSVRFS